MELSAEFVQSLMPKKSKQEQQDLILSCTLQAVFQNVKVTQRRRAASAQCWSFTGLSVILQPGAPLIKHLCCIFQDVRVTEP